MTSPREGVLAFWSPVDTRPRACKPWIVLVRIKPLKEVRVTWGVPQFAGTVEILAFNHEGQRGHPTDFRASVTSDYEAAP